MLKFENLCLQFEPDKNGNVNLDEEAIEFIKNKIKNDEYLPTLQINLKNDYFAQISLLPTGETGFHKVTVYLFKRGLAYPFKSISEHVIYVPNKNVLDVLTGTHGLYNEEGETIQISFHK